jgi:hypothetical protein
MVVGVIDSGVGAAGVSIGAGVMGAGFGFGAAFFATGLGVGAATAFFLAAGFFFGAAFTAFLATFALTDFLAFAFPFAFMGRVFFFAALFLADVRLAEPRLAFAIGRFFDLLFFAMVTLLLEIVQTRCESSPEKVCCHLCMTLESATGIA